MLPAFACLAIAARAARPLTISPQARAPAAACSATDFTLTDPAFALRRYLQLRAVLAGAPMADSTVESLVCRIEEATGPTPFDERKIWGDWQLCWQKNSREAAASQKALAPLPQYSNFMLDESGVKVFRNIVALTKRLRVVADVEYTAPEADCGTPGRLGSVIRRATLELRVGQRWGWRPIGLPLPLRGEGWLEVVYLSDGMRITRGNRGGVFVHLRPELLTERAAWPAVGGGSGTHRMAGRR
jgi:hypothetical protein|uniref:Plastid lipid-associated protein/fibrillin conserved domain-containing protein n=1 Tax=Emiliania huxleyi TaxID=2903 RepID=A0A6V2ZIL9_EMIHU